MLYDRIHFKYIFMLSILWSIIILMNAFYFMGIVRIMEDQLWLQLFSISCYEKYWRKAKNQMSIKKSLWLTILFKELIKIIYRLLRVLKFRITITVEVLLQDSTSDYIVQSINQSIHKFLLATNCWHFGQTLVPYIASS